MPRYSYSALLVFLAAANTSAFAPSSFTGKAVVSKPAFPPQSSTGGSGMALQMNIFDRFTRVAKSNINNILKSLEDPEKIMSQALEDMQSDLVKIRQSYAEITATQRRLLKQKEQAEALAADWYQRAQLALQKQNEALAKEALTRRQQALVQATGLTQQIEVQASSIDKLYDGMQQLEAKILESKSKKEQMVARARTAQSTQKVNDMLGGVTGKTSMDAFSRMEDKVEALEAAAEVSAEMGAMSGNMLPEGTTSLENEFKLLEGESAVDAELKKLKGLLNPSEESSGEGAASSASSASGGAAPPSSPAVDDEFEKLKKDAGL